MCLVRGSVGEEGGEWLRVLGLGFTNPLGAGKCWTCFCVFCCGGVGGVGRGVWRVGVMLCLCEL